MAQLGYFLILKLLSRQIIILFSKLDKIFSITTAQFFNAMPGSMKLQLYIYQCAHCGNKFKVPELLGEPYGEFILRSANGEMRYLFAIESKEFLEVGNIVDELLSDNTISELGKAQVLHQIFGIACDPAPDKSEFKICGDPVCPSCQSNNMYSWEPAFSSEVDDENVYQFPWNKFDYSKKKILIREAVERVLKNKDKLNIF